MVILGLLSHENLTGYDIKKKIDGGISFFWKGSFGSIYPSLNAMEKEGLVKKVGLEKKVGDSSGASMREKNYYAITDAGREVLLGWLKNSKAVNDLKYETLLKVYFGGTAEPEVTVDTITAFEAEISEALAQLKMYKENLAPVIGERDHLHYYLTVCFGVETYEGYLRWCQEAKELLKKTKMKGM